MNILGIIIKGLASTILGPSVSVLWTVTEWITGMRSGLSAAASLLLSGIIDIDFDGLDLGYEIDPNPDDFECELALAAASGIADAGVKNLISEFKYSRSKSGLITPTAIEIDYKYCLPTIKQVWKKDPHSGIYLAPNYNTANLDVTLKNIDSNRLQSRKLGRNLKSRKLISRNL
jgi:hypothetical protein